LSTKEIYAIFALILGQPALASEGCFAFLLFAKPQRPCQKGSKTREKLIAFFRF